MTAKTPGWHEYLFVGTHGHVAALQRKSGRKVWQTSLPRTGYAVVSIVVDDGRLYCACGGRAFALDPESGEIVWSNALSGLGAGFVFLTTPNTSGPEAMLSVLANAVAQAQAAAAATAH